MRPSTRAVATLLFASGFSALIYQTEWQRSFRLVFGASTGASAAVLGIFLGGLGLGGFLLGKRAEQSERPLQLYGNLEALIALSAGLTPFLSELAGHIYFSVGGSRTLGFFGATCLRLILATLVMGPTTVLMGGTLPAAARAVEEDDDLARGRSATLYALNTVGAVLGALAGTFFLFQLFGSRVTLWIACLLNLLVAVVARALGREADVVAPSLAGDNAAERRPAQLLIYVTAAVLGFAFLSLEMVWYRMLGPILGGTTYTFGLILATALVGIGAGAFVYSRRSDRSPATLSQLALTLGLEAFFIALPVMFGDDIALVAAYTRPMAAMGLGGLLLSWMLPTLIVVLPASLVSGYQFPLLLALLGRGKERVAGQVGLLYAFNTVGSIMGAILTGFVLIPKLGTVLTWRLATALLVVLALAFVGRTLQRERPVRSFSVVLAAAAALLSLLAFVVEGPSAIWRHAPIGAGRVSISGFDRNQLRNWGNAIKQQMIWSKDGIESSVGLSNEQGYAFMVNGKTDGNVFNDRATQVMVGLLPALLHPPPGPRSAFVIGLGTGMTAGWLGKLPTIERVDVAELEPVILDVARASSLANGSVLDNPKVSIFLGDGREFMLTSKQQYDVIASEPSNPYRAGIASLFTAEFYHVVAEHLKDEGLFAQWLQGYEVDAESIRVVLKTLRQAFPSVEAWFTMSGDFLLIASKTQRSYDFSLIKSRLEQQPYRDALTRAWLTERAEGVFSHFIADSEGVRQISELAGTQTNTDDTNFLEYAFARNVGRSGADTVDLMLKASLKAGHARPPVVGDVNWDLVDELRYRGWVVYNSAAPPLPIKRSEEERLRSSVVTQVCLGTKFTGMAEQWAKQPLEPRDSIEIFALGDALAHRGDERALEHAKTLEVRGFIAESALIQARYFAEIQHADEELAALTTAVTELRQQALPLCMTVPQVLSLFSELGKVSPELARKGAEALMTPFAVQAFDGLRQSTLQSLAFKSGDPDLCVRALGVDLEVPRWQEKFLTQRLNCLELAKHPMAERARNDLLEFLDGTAGDFDGSFSTAIAP
jgi:spermidine synthase